MSTRASTKAKRIPREFKGSSRENENEGQKPFHWARVKKQAGMASAWFQLWASRKSQPTRIAIIFALNYYNPYRVSDGPAQQGIIGQDVYDKLLADIDARLLRLEPG